MKEYKMRRGEYLEDRIPDLPATIEEYFGPVTGTAELDGHEVYEIAEPDNPVFERVLIGAGKYENKKDTLIVEFTERDPTELSPDQLEAAGEAVDNKNEFLLEATGRDAKARRDSMKRSVEDSETPDDIA